MDLEKKILIAVDGSKASQYAADYVGMMQSGLIKNLTVTLFYVMSSIPPFLRREAQRDANTAKQLRAMEIKNRQAADEALGAAQKRLLLKGMSEEAIELKAVPRSSDVARDILFEAEHGMYDALVLGRRGISKAQELFMGSVTNKIVQHAERLPIWIVGGKVDHPRVICAVDGSEGALKSVDHMGFMLGGNPDAEVTLFHVGATLANYCPLDFSEDVAQEIEGDLMHTDQECMDDFYIRAIKVLNEAGFSEDQIQTDSVEGRVGVAKAILKKAEKHQYGTIVLGRRGENRSFFLGHVSDKVLSKGHDLAVWIVG
jgi:nucleotide-binding universal stress UspA family protein